MAMVVDFVRHTNHHKALPIQMCIRDRLHIAVVAEGIEEPDQVYFLEKCGCDFIQGYVFAKPMPANDLDVYKRQLFVLSR